MKDAVKKASASPKVKEAKTAIQNAQVQASLAAAEAKDAVEDMVKDAMKTPEAQEVKAAVQNAQVQAALAKNEAEDAVKEVKKAVSKAAKTLKTAVTLQFHDNDYSTDRLIQSAKDVWQYDMGRDVSEIESISMYVKPEDNRVYCVINGTEHLDFSI